MTNMSFQSQLVDNAFSSGNSYLFDSSRSLDFIFTKHTPILPVIIGRCYVNDNQYQMRYSSYTSQFRSRIISTAKLIEIMDNCPHAIHVRMIGDNYYLAGKGFLARSDAGANFLELLYVAFVPYDRTNKSFTIDNVRLYVSRSIYKEENKRILPAMEHVMDNFQGELTLTNDIEPLMGSRIKIPPLPTLEAVSEYRKQLMGFCLHKIRGRLGVNNSLSL